MNKAIFVAISGLLIASVPALSNTVIPVNAQESNLASVINLSKNGQSNEPQIAVSGNNVYVAWAGAGFFVARSTDGGATFGTPVSVGNIEGFSYNFRIAVSGNNVYVVWQSEVSGRFNIFFTGSTDNGQTFSKPVNLSKEIRFSQTVFSHDPQILASGKNVYVAWVVSDGSWAAAYLATSSDAGGTFTDPINVSRNDEGAAEWMTFALSGKNVYVAWITVGQNATYHTVYHITFARSNDEGRSFEKPKDLSETITKASVAETARIAVSGDKVYVMWIDDSVEGTNKIMLAKSNDRGSTFSISDNAPRFAWRLSGVAISGDTIFAVWQDVHYNHGTFIMRITDGVTFDQPINLSNMTRQVSPYEDIPSPSVTAYNNKVVVAWRDAIEGGGFETFIAVSKDNGITFSGPINISNNAGDTRTNPQVVSSAGGVYVVWTDLIAENSDVFFARLPLDIKAESMAPSGSYVTTEDNSFEIWTAYQTNAVDGSSIYIDGRICGKSAPPEGTELAIFYAYFRDRTKITEHAHGPFIIYPESWCKTSSLGGIFLNITGKWGVSAVARWNSGGSVHEINSNTIDIEVKRPYFASGKIEKLDVKNVVEKSGGSNDGLWLSLLDWSSDGKFVLLAYKHYYAQGGSSEVFLGMMNPDTMEVETVDLPVTFEGISIGKVSPSNDNILISGAYRNDDATGIDIFVYNMKTKTLTKITNGSTYPFFGSADWTAGENIVYVDQIYDKLTHQSEGVTIWLADPDGTKRELYTGPENIAGLDVSPDGTKIAFAHPLYPLSPSVQLAVFDMERKEVKPITKLGSIGSPRWSPNSELIVYHEYGTSKPGGAWLWISNSDGSLNEYIYGGYPYSHYSSVISPDGSFLLTDINNNQLARIELAQPIPEFPINLMIMTAIGLIGMIVAFRFLARTQTDIREHV